MSNKVKVGVVGVGVLGRHHTRLYKQVEDAELVGIYDLNTERAEEIADEMDTAVFKEVRILAEKCDALSIAVPATAHHKTTLPLMNMNKHILMEKPLDASVQGAEKLVEKAEQNDLILGVGHVERFNPAMHYLEKRAGKTRFVEAHRLANYPPQRKGTHPRGTEVGVVLDLMIHDIDLVLTMVAHDCEVEKFDAVGIPVFSKTEDLASVRIKFTNGSIANLTASRVSMEPMRRFRVFQDDAYISMDYSKHSGLILKKGGKLGFKKKKLELDQKNALLEELGNFVQCVKHKKETGETLEPQVPGWQALRALKLAVEISGEIKSYNKKYGFEFK